jgi:AraC family transcriptional regulator
MPRTSTVQALGWEWPELGNGTRAPYRGITRARYTYRGDDFALGAFCCARRDPLWTQLNWIGEGHHIVFPTTSVGICVMSEDPVLAGPNHVVLYNPGDQYKRQLVSAEGDRSIFMVVRPERLRAHAGLSRSLDGSRLRFGSRLVPLRSRAHLVRWGLVRYLSAESSPDSALVEDACCFILDAVLAAAEDSRQTAAHHPVVNQAKAFLVRSFAEPVTLGQIAKELFVSPFHLARLFKAETGYTLHGYMIQLRLRRALDLLADPHLEVSQVGARVGFTTHSHFTESFRKAFHVTPSSVRRMDAERLRALLTP